MTSEEDKDLTISSLREEALYWRTKFEQLSYHVQALFQESTRLAAYQPPRARSAAARAIRSAALSTEERDTIRQNINLRDKAFKLEGDVANAEEKLALADRRIQDLERQVSELKLRLVVGFQAAVSGVDSSSGSSSPSVSVPATQNDAQNDARSHSAAKPDNGASGTNVALESATSGNRSNNPHRHLSSTPPESGRISQLPSPSVDRGKAGDGLGEQQSEFRRGGRSLPQPPASPAPQLAQATPGKTKSMKQQLSTLIDGERLIGAQDYLPVKSSVLKVQAVARGWLARRQLANGGLLRRGAVVLELLNTERKYVDDLHTILRDYAGPLAAGLSASTSAAAASAAAQAAAASGLLTSGTASSDCQGSCNPGLVSDLRRLFSPLEVILLYNENFLEALEQRIQMVSLFPATARVGDVVGQFADFLRCYVNYVTHFGQSLAVLSKCRQNSLFRRLEHECDQRVVDRFSASGSDDLMSPAPAIGLTGSVVGKAAAAAAAAATSNAGSNAAPSPRDNAAERFPSIRRSGRSTGHSYGGASAPSGPQLNSLLIKPIQRIPRYVLLLRELIKVTPRDLRDYDALTDALNLMQAVGEKLNESKRDAESFAVPKEAEIADLVQPHRRFVKEGAVRWWRDKAIGSGTSVTRRDSGRRPGKSDGSSSGDTSGGTGESSEQWPSDTTDPARVEHADCRLFLFNDCLIIARAKKGPGSGSGDVVGDSALPGASQQLAAALGSFQSGAGSSSSSSALPIFQVLAYVNLRHVTSVVPIPDDADAGLLNCFILDTPKRSLSLLALSSEARSAWIASLSHAVTQLKSNLDTLKMLE